MNQRLPGLYPRIYIHIEIKIFPVGRRQEVCRFASSGLRYTTVSGHCMTSAQLKTYVDFVWFVSSESDDYSFPSASLQNGDLFGSISWGG
jgi:hypothetical protein